MRVGSGLGVLIGFAVSVFPAHAEEFTVYKRLMEDRKAVTATVESADTLLARARIGGTVGSLETDEGDRVTAGQQLALIGDRKLALQIEGQDARMQSLKATRDNAEVEFRRAEQLFAAGTIPKVRFDTAKTAFEVADRTWAAQRKERDVVAQQSTEGAVLAPGDGRVIKVHVNTGSVVLPGEPIFTIASGAYLLRLRLPERHAQFLQSGQPVQVSPRGEHPAPDEPMREGRVALVYPRMDQGRVVAMECIKMELGEPDASGRRRPVPVEGSEFRIDCDLVVVSVGSNANPLLTNSTPDIALTRWGNIIGDPVTGKTSKKGVWAGGDIVTGMATVILAMGAGRAAANSMHDYLTLGW